MEPRRYRIHRSGRALGRTASNNVATGVATLRTTHHVSLVDAGEELDVLEAFVELGLVALDLAQSPADFTDRSEPVLGHPAPHIVEYSPYLLDTVEIES